MYFNPKSKWLRGMIVAMVMLWLAFAGQTFAFGQLTFSFMEAAYAKHYALPTPVGASFNQAETATETITNSDYGVMADGGYSAMGNKSVVSQVTAPSDSCEPIAHYNFENDANDSSGNGHHGTTTSGVSYSPSVDGDGQAIFFDGTEQRVTVPDHNQLDTDYEFTISAWVNPTEYREQLAQNGRHMILSKWYSYPIYGDYILSLTHGNDPGRVQLTVANTDAGYTDDSLSSPNNHTVPLNEWSHVAATFDNGTMKLFLNCELVATKVSVITHTELSEYTYDEVMIGNIWTNQYYEYGFTGGIDDVRLYNQALSGTEICGCQGINGTELSISKTGPESVTASAPITYTLTVTNSGQITATNLIITDTLPSGANYVSGGTLAGNVVSWSVPTLPPTSTTTVEFVVTATETITNSDYGVMADGGYSAMGSSEVTTTVVNSCYWDSFGFGVDDWITSAPNDSVLATFSHNGTTYPALAAVEYGSGKAVYAPGSTFSELHNITSPGNVRHQLFINSVKWVTENKPPSQTTILATYGHWELLTYHDQGSCCSTNGVQALEDEGYTVDVSFEIPTSLTGYDAVIMLGVGWGGSPNYPNPIYWSSAGQPPTSGEVATLLDFIQNGGGLVSSTETTSGADWMNPIGTPMQVTFGSISNATPLQGIRTQEHPIFLKEECQTDITLTKSGPATATAGDPITYTLTVTNSSQLAATNLTITDTLPSGATYVSGGTLAGDVVSWTLPTLPPTSTTTVEFVVTATETITNNDYAVMADGGYSATGSTEVVTQIDSLLAIHALAFDNDSTAPGNLSPLFPETMAGIVAATEGAPDKRALVLVDQDGEADTRIFEVYNGVVTAIAGLPDSSGVLSLALNEYDMTDGNTLGGFLKWTLDEYATAATKTSFSYVSHGTFLAPAVDFSTIFTDTTTLNNRSAQSSPLFPLPSIVYVKSALTDQHPQPSLITPHALQVALDVGTDNGSNPLDVLDIVHCFSASIEEFYELSNPNGTPYSKTMIGSPNYSYFAPEMLGRALGAVDGADEAATMANSIISAYDAVIEEADQVDGDVDVDHPRTLVALESSKVPPVKTLMDEMSWYVMQEFASNPTATKDKLAAAYSNTNAYYDTTYCAPQDWELDAPDGLVDIEAFMSQIANHFGSFSGTGLRALQVAGAVNQAVISHTAQNGIPWFADPLTPTWTLSGATISGLALYADLEGVEDGTERELSWHARFYTDTTSIDAPNDNPYPYLFVQNGVNGQTWGDVFSRFWDVKRQIEGVTTRTSACLVELPSVQQEGELSVEQLIFPQTGTVYKDYPSPLAAAIHAAQRATNPLVRFNVYDASSTLIFSDTVAAGYLVTGTHYIEAAKLWTPTTTASFTLEVMVDADNRFLEQDESDNRATMTDLIFTGSPFEMSATTLNNRQWFDSRTIDLSALTPTLSQLWERGNQSNQPLDFLVVQIYEYIPGVDPNTQVASTPHQVVIPAPSLPNVSFDLPLDINPGPLTLHLWGIAGGDINQGLVKVTFNYAPSNRSLGTGSDYYLFDAEAGDAISITLTVNSGEAKLYIWQPGNLWTAQMVNLASGQAGTIGFSPALAGEYLVMVEGLTAGTDYTLSSLRNGQVGGLAAQINRGKSSTTAVTTVQKAKPTFIEPIPDIPAEQIPTTIATTVSLQGRHDVPPPHPRWSVPLNVTLTIPGESSPRYTFTPTSDEYGRFSITGIESGSYEVRVKKESSLQTLLTHDFVAGSNNLDVGTLYEGDANNDNYVTILDFSLLANTFGKGAGDEDYDERADFDGNDYITILDFSLLASNFGQGGLKQPAQEPTTPTTSQASMNGAALLVEALTNAVNVGDIFTATVLIEADNQAIDGAQASLNFDPAVVEVEHLSGGNRLPLELLNQFDNSSGTIDFAAGSLVDFPSGAAIELLHIQFKALAASEAMTLAFQFDLPRQSDVTFGGTSLLSTHNDGTIIIQPAPTSITLDSFDAAKWERLPLISISAFFLALTAIVSLLVGWRYRRV